MIAGWLREDTNLITLRLDDNPIGNKGVAAVAQALTPAQPGETASVPGVARVGLSGCRIGTPGAAAWGRCLGRDPGIKSLWIGGNDLGDDGLAALGAGLVTNCTIQYLSLAFSKILGLKGTRSLAFGISRNRSLEVLDLQRAAIQDGHVHLIADAVGHSSIRKLDIEQHTGTGARLRDSIPTLCRAIRQSLVLQCIDFGDTNFFLAS